MEDEVVERAPSSWLLEPGLRGNTPSRRAKPSRSRLTTSAIAQVPPLGTAAFVRSLPLARLLLDAGAEINRQGGLGFIALHSAAQNNDLDLARELVARSADRQVRTTEGKTAGDLTSNDELRQLVTP